MNRSVFYITCPSNFWKLPNTIEGESFETALAIFLDMRTYNDSKEMESYKFSSIDLLINVNSEGKVVKTKIKGFDEFDKIDTNKVKNFLSNQVFEHKYIDKNVGEWCFSGSVSLANKNPKIAKRERKNEIRKRPSAEYIKSIYIPKNIEECFTQLDKLLDPKTIARMKKAKSASDAMTLHHFGLGMWLRNNWGLWGGSRLQKYMLDRNVEHSDSMSSTILEFYYDWLHDRHDGWKVFDKKK